MLAECRARLPDLRRIVETPSGEAGVRDVVGRRFALFPQPKRTDEEWAMWWVDYYDTLSDLPVCDLEAGMLAWIREPASDFLPKPGRLREYAMTTASTPRRAYERARNALAWVPPRPAPENPIPVEPPTARGIPEPSAEDKARVKKWAAEFKAQADTRRIPETPLPPIHGKTDETGITPELRALMARELP